MVVSEGLLVGICHLVGSDKSPGDGVYTYSRKLGFMGFAPGTYDVWVIVQNQIEAFKSKNPDNYALVHIGTFLVR